MQDLMVILETGFIFALVSMGVYITYKILDFPDLSVDGTFPLGAAISAILLTMGVNPWISLLAAALGGALAGATTAFLHVKLKISNLMSGILVMIALYSINLRIMDGKSNIPLFEVDTVFTSDGSKLLLVAVIMIIIKVLFDLFLKTKQGLLLVAVGDNEQVITTIGANKDNVKILGLMLSNGLVALAGGLQAQYNRFADVGMGTGLVVTGLAAVIIGVSLLSKLKVHLKDKDYYLKVTTLAIIGAILYKAAITVALRMNLNPNDLKVLTAVVVVIALSANSGVFKRKKKRTITKIDETSKGGVIDAKDTKAAEGF